MNHTISIKNLRKSYQDKVVLKDISFDVNINEIFALLGKNGAGKTTTLECIENLLNYEKGDIFINGKCGVQLQNSSLPKNMKIKEAFTYFSKWANVEFNNNLLNLLGNSDLLNMQYYQCSTGQKRRIHLIISLLCNPDILILDEPTAGLDIEGKVLIHEEIKRLKEEGKTIIIATHDMSEVQELCDHVVILNHGDIVFNESVDHLIDKSSELKISFSNDPILSIDYIKIDNAYLFKTDNINETLSFILNESINQNIHILDISMNHSTLDQRFLDLTGNIL